MDETRGCPDPDCAFPHCLEPDCCHYLGTDTKCLGCGRKVVAMEVAKANWDSFKPLADLPWLDPLVAAWRAEHRLVRRTR
jgi:hypothetical protein